MTDEELALSTKLCAHLEFDQIDGILWVRSEESDSGFRGTPGARVADVEFGLEGDGETVPDISDPATIGVMMQMTREAWGEECFLYPRVDKNGRLVEWAVGRGHSEIIGAGATRGLAVGGTLLAAWGES